MLYAAVATAASVFREIGRDEDAASLAGEFLAELRAGRSVGAAVSFVHLLASTLARLGSAEELVEVLSGVLGPWVEAAVALATGDLRRSADICAAMRAATEEASDPLWLAEELVSQNRGAEAEVELRQALAFYRSVGATRYVRQGEALLAASPDHAPPGRALRMQ